MSLDRADVRLLNLLQEDASLSLAALGERVGLSPNACWKRIKRLEDEGIIQQRVTLIDRSKVGLGVTVFAAVRAQEHDEPWLEAFATAVRHIPAVVEFYRMSGEMDYLLKIVCGSIEDYDRIYKRLIRAAPLRDISGFFAMEQIKYTTQVPIELQP